MQEPIAVHQWDRRSGTVLGKKFVFHDAEVESFSIDRDGTVKARLWTWSDVDHDKYFYADFTLSGCMAVSAVNYDPSVCYVHELRFEVSDLSPDIITVIFDGVELEFSCRKRYLLRYAFYRISNFQILHFIGF